MARRLSPLLFLPACTGAGLLACCPIVSLAADAGPPDRAPELTARWLPSCDPNEQRAYIVVSIFADGTVRYVGARQAAEVGERSTRIEPHNARYLASRAADFIRAPLPPARRAGGGAPPGICMEFEARVDGKMRVRRESIETRASKVFANDIARKVPLLQWACPGRTTPEEPQLSLAAFCDQWQRRSTTPR